MQLTWLSNAPWSQTGYGNQTRIFTPRLKALGHEVGIIAFYGLEGAVLHWQDIPVYPRARHPYGQDIMAAHSHQFGADLMFSLMDAFVIEPNQLFGTKWVPWYPVDMEPLPSRIREVVQQAYARIVYSRFGERVTQAAGLDCYYVPHGVETGTFAPKPQTEARAALAWPDDRFVVAMVAANKGNPSRKSFPEQLEAFARFHQRHPDSLLYLHTCAAEHGENSGVNLPELCEHFGLAVGTDVRFPSQYQLITGYPDSYMVNVYNAADVLLSVSRGEGFGIPILEAQACGTPVIVGDWTSMGELCFAGWKIGQADAERCWTPLAAWQWVPHVEAIVEALEQAWRNGKTEKLQARARTCALAYDADRVTREYWQPVLADLETRLAETKRAADQIRADWMALA